MTHSYSILDFKPYVLLVSIIIASKSFRENLSFSGYNITSCCIISHKVHLNLIGFAGTPTQTVYGGILLVTTAPAPIVHPLPIVTPAKIVTLRPIHTSYSITTSLSNPLGFSLSFILL